MNYTKRNKAASIAFAVSSALTLLAGCAGGDSNENFVDDPDTTAASFFDMQIPASLTGTRQAVAQGSPAAAIYAAASIDQPCAFAGNDGDDPFVNGYQMTKFMTSAVAAWTCVADQLIEISGWVPHNGEIVETENNTQDPGYEPDEPTHYSVVDNSDSQTSIYLYYGYDRAMPPQMGEDPQFYISWNEAENGDTSGRLIIDALAMNGEAANPEDPTMMRMDFEYTAEQKHADMYLRFGAGNEWAEGFRIDVSKDLTANPLTQVFVARGLMQMDRQFLAVPGVSEVPSLQMYTVSDKFGEGAAIANFVDVAVTLPLGPVFQDQNLGNYLFSKTDRYFFEADSDYDYVYKDISSAEYKGGSTTDDATNTTIQDHFNTLGLLGGTEVTDCLASSGNDVNCTAMMNAIFADGFAEQEPNQGTDPGDWRSVSLAGPNYLDSVYPNGMDWTGAFEFNFVP